MLLLRNVRSALKSLRQLEEDNQPFIGSAPMRLQALDGVFDAPALSNKLGEQPLIISLVSCPYRFGTYIWGLWIYILGLALYFGV